MATCDGVGASHDLIARLDKLAGRPGYQLTYSVGWELGGRERAALGDVPAHAWQIAVDAPGRVRERRADQACGDQGCAHRRCWIEEAHATELRSLPREGPASDLPEPQRLKRVVLHYRDHTPQPTHSGQQTTPGRMARRSNVDDISARRG
jgi:hypothetical protein